MEDEENRHEATSGPASAKGIRVDAGVVAVLSEVGGIFTFKEEPGMAPKFCLVENIVSLYSRLTL